MFSLLVVSLLSLVPQYVEGQAKATCNAGFGWMFNSLNQSPCDVAASLAGVCIGTTFSLAPLGTGLIYLGPPASQANSCRCSSVYYSLLAACSVCQDANFLKWSAYNPNCTVVYSSVFPQPIPSNVRVPHYAYLDVEGEDSFDPVLAQSAGGLESSAIPSSTGTTFGPNTSTVSSSFPNTNNGGNGGGKKSNAGAIAGGVVGGVIGLALIAGLVFWLLRRNNKPSPSPSSSAYDPVMASSGAMASQNPMSLAGSSYPSTPAPKVYDPNDPSTFPTNIPTPMQASGQFSSYTSSPDPQQQQQYMTPNYTGNSMQNNLPPARPHYTGAPEL